jgi:glycosyltransferase involved in cell wall biosynthesis
MTLSLPARPVRMMIASEFIHGSTARGLVGGFRTLGWDVAEVDLLHFALRGRGRLARAAARLLWKNSIAEYNAEILRVAELNKVELLLTIKGVNIARSTVERLRANGTRVVVFYPDVLFDHAGVDEAVLAATDLIVTSKSYHAPYLDQLVGPARHAFVHHGYCPSAHSRRHKPGAIPYRWDIGFIGNASPHKAAHLAAVAHAFPDQRFVVVGNGWTDLAKETPLAPFVLGAPLTGDYFARAIEETRINLAIHHGEVGPDKWQDLTSTRTFEIPAAGGFMLHVDNDEVRALYEPAREIDVFTGDDQLVERIGYYLANEAERATIAEAGHARCVPAYSLEARAREIATLLMERRLLDKVR